MLDHIAMIFAHHTISHAFNIWKNSVKSAEGIDMLRAAWLLIESVRFQKLKDSKINIEDAALDIACVLEALRFFHPSYASLQKRNPAAFNKMMKEIVKFDYLLRVPGTKLTNILLQQITLALKEGFRDVG